MTNQAQKSIKKSFMPSVRLYLCYLLIGICLSCQKAQSFKSGIAPFSQDSLVLEQSPNTSISKLGKLVHAPKLQEVYTIASLDSLPFPILDRATVAALENQLQLLKIRKQKYNQQVGNLPLKLSHLESTVNILLQWQHLIPIGLEKQLEAHQIWGKDQRGNVQFTAYYAPILRVSAVKTPGFSCPIRSAPRNWQGALPSRKEIEEGALDTCTSVLAYASSKVDIYYLQLQGSGFIEYTNGKQELLTFDGENNQPYVSIEKHLLDYREEYGIKNVSMNGIRDFLSLNPALEDSILNINPSYTFFRKGGKDILGAGQVPLSPEISIAVDPRYIPLGSCLLAAVPITNKKGIVVGHEFRLLLAQDVGGAIRGAGHIDVYFGTGKAAQKKANYFNHYGRLWLLLPKDKAEVEVVPVEEKIVEIDFDSWFSS